MIEGCVRTAVLRGQRGIVVHNHSQRHRMVTTTGAPKLHVGSFYGIYLCFSNRTCMSVVMVEGWMITTRDDLTQVDGWLQAHSDVALFECICIQQPVDVEVLGSP
jgi:hypothetical protein